MTSAMPSLLVLGLAVLVDLVLGEPPTALHPVAWMGSAIGLFRKLAPRSGRVMRFVSGLLLMLVGVSVVAGLAWLVVELLQKAPLPVAIIVEAMLLKTALSIRGLISAGRQVQRALAGGNLVESRHLLSWHLVSRDTKSLSEPQVAAATIESLAENTSDSIVAPLLFYAVAGLPGALAYRFINTCDAMLGYRDAEREWLGKAPARLDDLANLVPARLTALLVIVAAPFIGGSLRGAAAIWWRDRRLTASPNAGQPMSAAAGALGVELEKVDHYRLGHGLRMPEPADIGRAIRLLLLVALLSCLITGGVLICRVGPASNTSAGPPATVDNESSPTTITERFALDVTHQQMMESFTKSARQGIQPLTRTTRPATLANNQYQTELVGRRSLRRAGPTLQ